MHYFKHASLKGQPILRHVDEEGRKNLLIIMPPGKDVSSPMSQYAQQLLTRVLQHTEGILGAWATVTVATATETLGKLVKRVDADHILLVGKGLSQVLIQPSGLPADTNMFGIPVSHAGRRWVATLPFSTYGFGRNTPWQEASMLGHLYRHLELLRIGLPGWENPAEPVRTKLVRNRSDWEKLRALLDNKRTVAIDTETVNLERIHNTMLTIQFGFDGITGWVLPIAHKDSELSPSLLREIIAYLKEYFERADDCLHIYANAKFDLHQIYTVFKVRWYAAQVYDLLLGEFNLDENRMLRPKMYFAKGESWGLGRICLEYGMHHYINAPIGKGDRDRLADVDLEKVAPYAALDVALPIRAYRMQLAIAKKRARCLNDGTYTQFKTAVTEVDGVKIQQFVNMERNGLPFDRKYSVYLQGPSSPVLKEIRESEAKFRQLPEVLAASKKLLDSKHIRSRSLFGAREKKSVVFDHNKPANRQLLFFDSMKLKPVNTTDAGTPSVDDAFKRKYKDNPVVKAYTEIGEAEKMLSTFVVGIYVLVRNEPDNKDGAVRTTFSWIIITGRSGCCAAWTPVTTERGVLPIKDVRVGDKVWTHRGRWRKVTRTLTKGYERMYEVVFSNGDIITCTKEHRFLIDGYWKSVGELNVHFEKMGSEQGEYTGGVETLSAPEMSYPRKDRTASRYPLSERALRRSDTYVRGGEIRTEDKEVCQIEACREESYAGQNAGEAPQLEGWSEDTRRIHNDSASREALSRTSDYCCTHARVEKIARVPGRPSYRRGQTEQLGRQPSNCYPQGSFENPQHESRFDPGVKACGENSSAQITEIRSSRTLLVYDISVEEDESYQSGPVFSHNSSDPNLQNIPSRNKKRAKMIKRQFICNRGELYIKRDFSAHEVRMWGITARDRDVGEMFWRGMKVRLRYEMMRVIPKDKEQFWKDELRAADVHRQNSNLFYGVDPRNVPDAMRNQVKGTIFGVTYGMTMRSLGVRMYEGTIGPTQDAIDTTKKRIAELKAQIAGLRGE